ncbi:coiled-coil domain-containing protein [Streptacidiphilus sp. PAMC 29251]
MPADPSLRDQLAEALRAAPVRGTAMRMTVLTELYGPVDALTDAVLAVVQPELDRLRAEVRKVSIERDFARGRADARGRANDDLDRGLQEERETAARWRRRAKSTEAELNRFRSAWQSARHRAWHVWRAHAVHSAYQFEQAQQRAVDAGAERDRAMASVPLVCSDDRHQAKVRGLEAELAAVEETAAEQQQNALHWQERAQAAEAERDQFRTRVLEQHRRAEQALQHLSVIHQATDRLDYTAALLSADADQAKFNAWIRWALRTLREAVALGAAPTPAGAADACRVDECAQGCPGQCRHRRAADDLTRLDEELGMYEREREQQ